MTRLAVIKALSLLTGDVRADRVVPPEGLTARLTTFTAATMAFLGVFALALSLASGRLAARWSDALSNSATVRISAPDGQVEAQTIAAIKLLESTPGVDGVRVLTADEQRALLEPWFGPDLPVEDLPIPQLIEIRETGEGFDAAGLRLRLAAEVPGAVLDDHTRWRRSLVRAANGLRLFGWVSLLLIAATTAAMVTLAANAALAANSRVISVLRLVGATDAFVTRAFVRRFTLRSLAGAAVGSAIAMAMMALLPSSGETFLTGLGFRGWHWILPLLVPLVIAAVAFWATRRAARKTLEEQA